MPSSRLMGLQAPGTSPHVLCGQSSRPRPRGSCPGPASGQLPCLAALLETRLSRPPPGRQGLGAPGWSPVLGFSLSVDRAAVYLHEHKCDSGGHTQATVRRKSPFQTTPHIPPPVPRMLPLRIAGVTDATSSPSRAGCRVTHTPQSHSAQHGPAGPSDPAFAVAIPARPAARWGAACQSTRAPCARVMSGLQTATCAVPTADSDAPSPAWHPAGRDPTRTTRRVRGCTAPAASRSPVPFLRSERFNPSLSGVRGHDATSPSTAPSPAHLSFLPA